MRLRCIQFLFGLLIFSICLTIAGFVASYATGRKIAAFASDSHTVVGTVTAKHENTVAQEHKFWLFVQVQHTQVYALDVRFKTQDGGFFSGSTGIAETAYEGLLVGSPIQVTYVGSNPSWFYVGDNAPKDPDVTIFSSMFEYGLGASVFLVILLVTTFWDSGLTSAGQPSRRLRALQRFSSRVPRQRMASIRTARS